MIKAIFFDLHEVITYGDFSDIYEKVASRLNISTDVVNEYHKDNLGKLLIGERTSHDMLVAFGLSQSMSVQELLDVWTEETVKLMYTDSDMISLLSTLRGKYTLGALTNLTEQRYGADIEMKLHDYFDFSILSFKEGTKKPEPVFFHKALEVAVCAPSESVFIDDQAKNTDAAAELGINSIQFENYGELVKKLHSLGIET